MAKKGGKGRTVAPRVPSRPLPTLDQPIVDRIIRFLDPTTKSELKTVAKCCLVSKTCLETARPILYRVIVNQLDPTVIAERKAMGAHLRVLEKPVPWDDEEFKAWPKGLIWRTSYDSGEVLDRMAKRMCLSLERHKHLQPLVKELHVFGQHGYGSLAKAVERVSRVLPKVDVVKFHAHVPAKTGETPTPEDEDASQAPLSFRLFQPLVQHRHTLPVQDLTVLGSYVRAAPGVFDGIAPMSSLKRLRLAFARHGRFLFGRFRPGRPRDGPVLLGTDFQPSVPPARDCLLAQDLQAPHQDVLHDAHLAPHRYPGTRYRPFRLPSPAPPRHRLFAPANRSRDDGYRNVTPSHARAAQGPEHTMGRPQARQRRAGHLDRIVDGRLVLGQARRAWGRVQVVQYRVDCPCSIAQVDYPPHPLLLPRRILPSPPVRPRHPPLVARPQSSRRRRRAPIEPGRPDGRRLAEGKEGARGEGDAGEGTRGVREEGRVDECVCEAVGGG
ncbi:RHTO0S17e00408g1_1 [Rhodotorula toruloides]|uniref:RHTO0S17e00408g1_1 n=1 Tax=Rhodotorula toruloides TaxID=5286 RepID=A0A061BE74_RHOTO|nr:RHTO0S17e00408g1_1 [Rhodotorula toruloides]